MAKKIVLVLLTVIIISTVVFKLNKRNITTYEYDASAPTVNTFRNNKMISDDDYIYYVSISDNDKLYRVKNDGSDKQKISDDAIWSIVGIHNDFIYYMNESDDKLYKIKTDGSNSIKLSDIIVDRIIKLDGEWIYLITETNERVDHREHSRKTVLYKVNVNTNKEIKVCDDDVYFAQINGDFIYYINISEGEKLYKIRKDGKKRQKLCEDKIDLINAGSIISVGDWIYYKNHSEEDKLYKIKVDGTQKMQVTKSDIKRLIYADEYWIYYQNGYKSDNKHGMMRISPNGIKEELITDKDVMGGVVLADGWLYYTISPSVAGAQFDRKLYKVRLDGKDNKKLTKTDYITEFYILGDWIYYYSGMTRSEIGLDEPKKIWRLKNTGSKLNLFEE